MQARLVWFIGVGSSIFVVKSETTEPGKKTMDWCVNPVFQFCYRAEPTFKIFLVKSKTFNSILVSLINIVQILLEIVLL